MKVIIDLIEDIRTEISNDAAYTMSAMLLKDDPDNSEKLLYAGERALTDFEIDHGAKKLLFKIKQESQTLLIGNLVKHLLILDMDAMMYSLQIAVNQQYQELAVIGFGKSEEDNKYILFIKI